VRPRAARQAVGGTHDRALLVCVRAPATEGRANRAVRLALAEALAVRPAAVSLVAGERARRKRVRIDGDPEALTARLAALAGGAAEV
jgi:uncharacterized protein (TIGR00251 family)